MSSSLIIDQGGQSTRAIVFSSSGDILAQASEPLPAPLESNIEHIEFSPQIIIDSAYQILEKINQQLSIEQLKDIQYAACICQRSSIIACNKNTGKALGNMISWQDTRNAEWLAEQQLDYEELQKLSGLRINAHAGASKMRWLLESDPMIHSHATNKELLFIPWGAWFTSQLIEEKFLACDPILASRTGLTAYGKTTWHPDLLKIFSIPEDCLPPIQTSIFDYGNIAVGKYKIPLKLLGGDQNFIPLAYGESLSNNSAFLNIGTGAFILALSDTANPRLLKSAMAIEEYKKTKTLLEGTINGCATALLWWQQQSTNPISFEEIDRSLPSVNEAPLFINTLAGSGSPWWLPKSEPYFLAEKSYSQEQKAVAIIENILFSINANLEAIRESNENIQKIIISGGLAKLDNLCQKLADITQLPVVRYSDNEASARGAAFYLTKQSYYEGTVDGQFVPKGDEEMEQRYCQFLTTMQELAAKH